jgi:hypothetical protein
MGVWAMLISALNSMGLNPRGKCGSDRAYVALVALTGNGFGFKRWE